MMNVTRFKMKWSTRRRNQIGKGGVPCMVSDKWLAFPEQSDGFFQEGEYITIAVMTDAGDSPKCLSKLVVTREDLIRALEQVNAKK